MVTSGTLVATAEATRISRGRRGAEPVKVEPMRTKSRRLLAVVCLLLLTTAARAEKITVVAASDLRFAMQEIVAGFRVANPGQKVETIYGSSGMFLTQIQRGAPFDIFFSADIAFPRTLARNGFAASEVKPYAIGRIVLWSGTLDASKMTLASLAEPRITRIAIANPQHAPYGQRAEEALRVSGLWDRVEPKLVYGENISQTAQYVQSGSAQVGIIALSLALSPELSSKGDYWLIPDKLHKPLEQGYIITKRAANNRLAKQFADYIASDPARAVMSRYGFVLPGAVYKN